MRRQKNKPDTRLNWRDPDMPVIREYRFASGKTMGPEIAPDFEQGFRGYMLENSQQPDYRNDPDYNANRRRK